MPANTVKDQLDVNRDFFEEEYLQEYSECVAKSLKISSPKFRVKTCTKEGDNFMGIIHRVLIEGKKDGIPTKVSTILKVPPKDELSRLTHQVDHLFPREEFFYTKIVPVFESFLETRSKSLENIPKCYFSSSVDHKEAIYLEDLQPLGFVMRDRIKQLDFAHASLVFRALGRFHALSFVLRDQKPEIFATKVASVKEPLFRPDFIHHEFFTNGFRNYGNLVKMALAEEDPKYLKRFTEFSDAVSSHVEQSCTGSFAEPYAVLAHGDAWTNNMLFKYDQDTMEPRDLYFLDFQIARYASPATDITYTMFTSCSKKLRDKHFDELIKIYHESLSDYLRELGSDPEKLFPYNALLDQLKKFSKSAAVMVAAVLSAITSQGDDVSHNPTDINRIFIMLEERLQRDHFWRNTLKDGFKDLIDMNYI